MTHGLVVLAFVNAVLAGLFVGGQIGLVSFVALLTATAGLWIAHSIHSLGNATAGDEYNGILYELLGTDTETDDGARQGFDSGRFGRLLGLIALVTAIIGFLIAVGISYDENQQQWRDRLDEYVPSESTEREPAGSR